MADNSPVRGVVEINDFHRPFVFFIYCLKEKTRSGSFLGIIYTVSSMDTLRTSDSGLEASWWEVGVSLWFVLSSVAVFLPLPPCVSSASRAFSASVFGNSFNFSSALSLLVSFQGIIHHHRSPSPNLSSSTLIQVYRPTPRLLLMQPRLRATEHQEGL